MKRYGIFRKVRISVETNNDFLHHRKYVIRAHYNGVDIVASTDDADIYDWIDDDSNKPKQHDALRSAYWIIRNEYEKS